MANTLREIYKTEELPGYIIADKIGISRSKVYHAIRKADDIPSDTRIGDLKKIAGALGKRVVISFEPIEAQ